MKESVSSNKFDTSILNRFNGENQNEKRTAEKEDGPNLLIAVKKQDWSQSCSRIQM